MSSQATAVPNDGIFNFATRAELCVATAESAGRLLATRERRVLRRYSLRDAAAFLGIDRKALDAALAHPDAPPSDVPSTAGPLAPERTLSVDDLVRLRALASGAGSGPQAASRPGRLHWRRPGDPLAVVTCGSQKGGSGKSLTAAHFAQYAHLHYGLRVGVIDADPQSSLSLYFASDKVAVATLDAETFVGFMGVGAPRDPFMEHDPARLDAFWKPTPWPGLRMMPGGAPIQEADISLHLLATEGDPAGKRVYRLLHDALRRWEAAHPPQTAPEDLLDAEGRLDEAALARALTETLDLIVIDTAPALTLAQLNAVCAADMLVVPQTMRGFDLSTLRIYLGSLAAYGEYITHAERALPDRMARPPCPSYILPTIVSSASDTDIRHVAELYANDPEVVCPVYYQRSEAVANAAEEYMSIYEYAPPRSRRASAVSFMANACAVGDALLTRAAPRLPSRGFANAFIRERLPGAELWTGEAA